MHVDMLLIIASNKGLRVKSELPDHKKKCPCNRYPFIPHIYIVKLGYAGINIFFSYFCSKTLIVGSRKNRLVDPQSMF